MGEHFMKMVGEKVPEHLLDEAKEAAALEHHNSNLYDQNEDAAGEKVDLATGENIDNSTDLGEHAETVSIRDSAEGEKPEIDLDLETQGDAAAKWLAENDPTLQ